MLVVLLQLYWFSFGVIGLAGMLLLRRSAVVRRSGFWRYLHMAHPGLQMVLCVAAGLLWLLPLVALSYILEWPLWVLQAAYTIELFGALGVMVVRRRMILRALHWPRLSGATFCLALLAGASLLFDYILSLKLGAPLYGDAPVQLAKVTFFQHAHLALADPFLGNNGVVDPRYSTNLLDTYQAVAANLFHTTAVTVWTYSYAFYRLVIWLSLFGLVRSLLGRKYRHLAYAVVFLLPIVWGGYFLFAELPDRIVLAWVALFLLGLKLWLEDGDWPVLLGATLLIGATHALYALIALGYVLLVSAALLVSRAAHKRQLLVLATCAALLLPPIAINVYYPSHSANSSKLFLAGIINGSELRLHHYGPFLAAVLPAIPLVPALVYVAFGAYVWLAAKTRRTSLTVAAYAAMFLGFVFMFRATVLALVGYALLVMQAKGRAQRTALLVLVCYYGLLIYNPLFWHVAHGRLPLWMVARFGEFNILAVAAPVIGFMFLLEWPLTRLRRQRFTVVVLLAAASLFVWYFPRPQVNDYRIDSMQNQTSIRLNLQRRGRLSALARLSPVLKNQVVYSNDPNLAIDVPAVTTANVLNYNAENESPMTNVVQRAQCAHTLAYQPRLEDLRAAGVTRIVTDLPYSRRLVVFAQSHHYISLVAQVQGYEVYAVSAPEPKVNSAVNSGVCAIPFGQ